MYIHSLPGNSKTCQQEVPCHVVAISTATVYMWVSSSIMESESLMVTLEQDLQGMFLDTWQHNEQTCFPGHAFLVWVFFVIWSDPLSFQDRITTLHLRFKVVPQEVIP